MRLPRLSVSDIARPFQDVMFRLYLVALSEIQFLQNTISLIMAVSESTL